MRKTKLQIKKALYYKEQKLNFPWKFVFKDIIQRCTNPNHLAHKWYYDKGIKCEITEEEVKQIWFRDKAFLMKKPSIDRIKSNLNYNLDNCRFIEMKDNAGRERKTPILQFDLQGNFIREYTGVREAGRLLNGSHKNISDQLTGKQNTAFGYIWRFKNG